MVLAPLDLPTTRAPAESITPATETFPARPNQQGEATSLLHLEGRKDRKTF
jgi:hypothetical protein